MLCIFMDINATSKAVDVMFCKENVTLELTLVMFIRKHDIRE